MKREPCENNKITKVQLYKITSIYILQPHVLAISLTGYLRSVCFSSNSFTLQRSWCYLEARVEQSLQHLDYRLGSPQFESPQGQEILLFSKTSRVGVRSTQPPSQYILGLFFELGGYRGQGMKCNTHLHLTLRLRINGHIILLPVYAFMV